MSNLAKAGRPTKYKKEYCEQAYKLCLLGATDAELADFFEVTESTLNLWKKNHKEFSESLKKGKVVADAEVANKLYKKAVGYEQEAVKIFQFQGQEVIVPYIEKYQPDATSAIFWLKNRQRDKWRDKQEVEHSGAQPVTIVDDIE